MSFVFNFFDILLVIFTQMTMFYIALNKRRQFQMLILNDIRFNNFYRSILQLTRSIEF